MPTSTNFNTTNQQTKVSITMVQATNDNTHTEETVEYRILSTLAGSNLPNGYMRSFAWKDGILVYDDIISKLFVDFIPSDFEQSIIHKEYDLSRYCTKETLDTSLQPYGDEILILTDKAFIYLDANFNIGKEVDISAFQINDIKKYPFRVFPEKDKIIYSLNDGVYISSISTPAPICIFENTYNSESSRAYDEYYVSSSSINEHKVIISHVGFEKLKSILLYDIDTNLKTEMDIRYEIGLLPAPLSNKWYFISYMLSNLQIGNIQTGNVQKLQINPPSYGLGNDIAISQKHMFYIQDKAFKRLDLENLSSITLDITHDNNNLYKIINANDAGNMLLVWDNNYRCYKICLLEYKVEVIRE